MILLKKVNPIGLKCLFRQALRKNSGTIPKGNKKYANTRNSSKYIFTGLFLGSGIAAAIALEWKKWNSYKAESSCEEPMQNSNPKTYIRGMKLELSEAVKRAREIAIATKDEVGAPGLSVGVSVDGVVVWEEGFGYADIENRVQCTPDTVMRIASISKAITMTVVAGLWQLGKLDLDKPIQEYVPSFPQKMFEGEKVIITTRHLLSHISGIRHYDRELNKQDSKKNSNETVKTDKNPTKAGGNKEVPEFEKKEYFLKDKFDDLESALKLFKDDPLHCKPGTKYLYTTHGWTLVSAVVEAVVKEPFPNIMKAMFHAWGMNTTYMDENDPLIYNRARHYMKTKGRLVNTPYVDNSYKWAGGGYLSTVGDLVHFGNIMLYSFQYRPHGGSTSNTSADNMKESKDLKNQMTKKQEEIVQKSVLENKKDKEIVVFPPSPNPKNGFLKHETVETIWKPVVVAGKKKLYYAMGWFVSPQEQQFAFGREQKHWVAHTGGAVGASSVLLITPRKDWESTVLSGKDTRLPKGIIVSMITNLQSVPMTKAAVKITELFDNVDL